MKLDKEKVIVLAVAAIILIAWWTIYPRYFANNASGQTPVAEGARVQTTDAGRQAVPPPQAQSAVPAVPTDGKPVPPPQKQTKLPSYPDSVLSNNLISVWITPSDGSIAKINLKKYNVSAETGKHAEKQTGGIVYIPSGFRDFQLSMPLALVSIEKPVPAPGALTLTRTYADGGTSLKVTQVFSLAPDSYSVKCVYELKNMSAKPVVIPRLEVWNSGLPQLLNFSGDVIYGDTHNVEHYLAASKKQVSFSPSSDQAKYDRNAASEPVEWVGSSNKYFASVLFAKTPFDGGTALSRKAIADPLRNGEVYYEPSIAGVYKNMTLMPGASASLEFSCFTGPKSMKEVSKLPPDAIGILHLSRFSFMEFLARPLVVFLNWLKDLCGSYGLAIILLTVIVRIVFWPITQKGNRSMRKMQKIQPLVKEIQAKFKENPQLMNQKMMELYKKEGVNPVSGCLPVLLQIPVFIALYCALDGAVELRHVSFLWATDLTKPDLVGPQFFFGYGIHPLALMMTGLMVLQQKMTPSATMDPIQHKMMMAMPIVMLFMLYNLPSGLTLYWTVSQIFSILQMKYTEYAAKREEAAAVAADSKTT